MLARLPPCRGQACSNSPLSVSQRWTVPLALPLASKRPAGSKATLATSLRCHSNGLRRHSKVRSNLPSVVSQSDTVPSREPPASLPSPGSNATHLTARWFHSSARTTPTARRSREIIGRRNRVGDIAADGQQTVVAQAQYRLWANVPLQPLPLVEIERDALVVVVGKAAIEAQRPLGQGEQPLLLRTDRNAGFGVGVQDAAGVGPHHMDGAVNDTAGTVRLVR